jgi:hypothetical protein
LAPPFPIRTGEKKIGRQDSYRKQRADTARAAQCMKNKSPNFRTLGQAVSKGRGKLPKARGVRGAKGVFAVGDHAAVVAFDSNGGEVVEVPELERAVVGEEACGGDPPDSL